MLKKNKIRNGDSVKDFMQVEFQLKVMSCWRDCMRAKALTLHTVGAQTPKTKKIFFKYIFKDFGLERWYSG